MSPFFAHKHSHFNQILKLGVICLFGFQPFQARAQTTFSPHNISQSGKIEPPAHTPHPAELNQKGLEQDRQGHYVQALSLYQQALTMQRALNDRPGQAQTLNYLGALHRRLGNYGRALDCLEQAIAIQQDLGDRLAQVQTLNNQAKIYYLQGNHRQGLTLNQRSLAIFREESPRPFLTPQSVHHSLEARILNSIGIGYVYLQRYDQAKLFLEQALAIRRALNSDVGATLHNLGWVSRLQGQESQAFGFYQQALADHQRRGDRQSAGKTLGNIGYMLNLQNNPTLAILFYKQAIQAYESIRQNLHALSPPQQATYAATVADTYRELADLLLQQDRILEAQQVLDLLKVKELDNYLQNTRSTDLETLIILKPEEEILRQYQELQSSAIEIGQELSQLHRLDRQSSLNSEQEQRIEQLIALETDIHEQFNNFINNPEIQTLISQLIKTTDNQNLNLTEINALSDNLRSLNAALIYPLVLEDRLELILSTPDSPPIRRTVTRTDDSFDPTELKHLITQFRSSLRSMTQFREAEELAQRLYAWLIAPLEDDLDALKPETLIYAPDGVLRYIPLATLHDGEQWLIERYRINNIVARSVTDFDTPPKASPQVLAGAFGSQSKTITLSTSTDTRSFPFSGLPFTLTEVESIETLVSAQTMVEDAFDRKTLLRRLNSFDIVHLATHGLFLSGAASDSFIALGSGEILPLAEIANLRMSNVDLVVLSACETAVGGVVGSGEEILGLGYQFQRAGAKAAIASLWQVDDEATGDFMSIFYHGLQQGMTKAQALQAAQQYFISNRTYDHPYYWAPFILIGNGL